MPASIILLLFFHKTGTISIFLQLPSSLQLGDKLVDQE